MVPSIDALAWGIMGSRRTLTVRIWHRSIIAAGAGLALLALGSPAAASNHEVDVGIVFIPGQTCSDGSDVLRNSAASPFDVAACFTDSDGPISGRAVYLDVVHADGSTERLEGVTDADGNVTFTVTPTAAGETTATICDAEGCYGTVEFSSDNPPPPPVVPYAAGGGDIGPSAEESDASLDVIDAYEGNEAGPEISADFAGIDISSISYAGLVDGRATFKVRMVGNGRELFDSGPSRWDMSVSVTTPEGTSYSLSVRNNEGSFDAGANNGAESISESAAVALDWSEDGQTACISASGVDVPPGSTVTVFAAASTDPLSSGYYDQTSVVLVPGGGSETNSGGTETEADDGGSDTTGDTSGAATTSDDGGDAGGGFPVLPTVGVIGGLLAGLGWWWSRHETTPEEPSAPVATTDRGPADDFLDAFFSLGAPSAATVDGRSDEETSELWAQASAAETRVQEQIEAAVREALEPAMEAYQDYLEAVELFREKFVKVMSASTELQGMLRQWAEVQDIAQKQDIAFAIVSLVLSGGAAAGKLSGWINRAAHVPWHRSTLTGRMIATGGKGPARAGATAVGGRGVATLADDVTAGAARTPTPAMVTAAEEQSFVRMYMGGYYTAKGGQHPVVIHGSRNSGFVVQRSADASWVPTTVGKVAAQVRRSGWREGQPIQLMSCFSGSNGTGAALAANLKTWVVAPTDRLIIGISQQGRGYIAHEGAGFYRAFDPNGVLRYVNYGFGWMKLP
ncbi:MAG: Ig-like domain-containing protein [Acidimicrobiales bacterium]|nr:Ig-like domain-containing protein [Acidimicrobiales bacterium]